MRAPSARVIRTATAQPRTRFILSCLLVLPLLMGLLALARPVGAAYVGQLEAPAPPASAQTFAWTVGGAKSGAGAEISHVELSGCWTAAQVVAAGATDAANQPLTTAIHVGGPKRNRVEVKDLGDALLPIRVEIAFVATYGSTDTGTALSIKTGGGKASTTTTVGGPTCAPPAPTTPTPLPSPAATATATATATPMPTATATMTATATVTATATATATPQATPTPTATVTPSPSPSPSPTPLPTPLPHPVPAPPAAPLFSGGGDDFSVRRYTRPGTASGSALNPEPIAGVERAIGIAAGWEHSLVIAPDGTVLAWGGNTYYQLGLPVGATRTPATIPGLGGVVAVAAGSGHSLALRSDGTVWAWGNYARTGHGGHAPAAVPGLTRVVAIAAGAEHSLALTADGAVWAWGDDTHGQLGRGGAPGDRALPARVADLPPATAIAAGQGHSLVVAAGGVWSWGLNTSVQLGYGGGDSRATPGLVELPDAATAVAAGQGGHHSLALLADGSVWSWGANVDGQLGRPTSGTITLFPDQVPGLAGIGFLAAGQGHSFARAQDGTVWGWGRNDYGQLGDGTRTRRPAPVALPNLAGALALSGGTFHSLALRPIAAAPQGPCTPGVIPGRFIVALRDAVADPAAVAAELAAAHGLDVTHTYEGIFKGFAAGVPAGSEAALRADPRVWFVDTDRVVCGQADPQQPSTGLRRVGGTNRAGQGLPTKGTGVGVAVLDSGIAPHPDLPALPAGKNCVPGADGKIGASASDNNGHGTHVAGIIGARDNGVGVVGLAPGATLHPVKVLDKDGQGDPEGTSSWTICGLTWAGNNAATIDVVNMSMMTLLQAAPSNPDCSNATNDGLHTAICRAAKAGLIIVVSAGNNRVNIHDAPTTAGPRQVAPAVYEEVITVSALADFDGRPGGLGSGSVVVPDGKGGELCTETGDDTHACFSNYGREVDIAAPGVDIRSTVPQGQCQLCDKSGYASYTGTSQAAPFVAAAVALYLEEHPGASRDDVLLALTGRWEAGPIAEDPDILDKEGILNVGYERLYAASFGSNSVRSLDLTTGVGGATIGVTGPARVAVSPDARVVYVAPNSEAKIYAFDPNTLALVRTLTLPARPTGLAVSPDSRHLYVPVQPATGGERLLTVDATTGAVASDLAVGGSVHAMLVDPLGNQLYLWVAQFIFGQDSLVRAYNLDDAFVAESLRGTVSDPYMNDMELSPDGRYLYTAHSNGEVWVFNLATLGGERILRVPGRAASIAADYRGDRLYVGVGGATADDPHRVLEVDPHTGAILASLTVDSVPHDLLVSASGRTLLVQSVSNRTTAGKLVAFDLLDPRGQRWALASDAAVGMLALYP